MISVANLSFSYEKKQILNAITYHFEVPKIYTIIGPNGAGKSTLMKCLAGMLKKKEGSIEVLQKNIDSYKRKTLARSLAFIPQNYYTNFDYSVEDIVKMGRFPYANFFTPEKDDAYNIIYQTMEKLDLLQYKDKSIQQLSGGEMQRTFLARTIVQNTPIILLDESFANLDIHHQIDIAKILMQLQRDENKLILMVTHNLNLASEFSDEIILLKNGKIYDAGDAVSVLTKNNLKEVYSNNVQISTNPISGRPLIFFSR